MTETETEIIALPYDDEPSRIVRVRLEGPEGYTTAAPLPHVIVVHGFKGFMHWGFFPELSRRITHKGMVCVSLNVSGSGVGEDLETFSDPEGFAKNTYTRELEDVARVRALTRSGRFPGLDSERAAILGHSRGGAVALIAAAEDGTYASVVTWAALDRVDPFDDDTKERWRREGHILVHNARTGQDHRMDLGILRDVERNAARLDVLAACRRLETPVLVVHGTSDDGVPFQASRRIVGALPHATHEAVRGAGHTFGAGHPFRVTTPELERAIDASLEHLARGFATG